MTAAEDDGDGVRSGPCPDGGLIDGEGSFSAAFLEGVFTGVATGRDGGGFLLFEAGTVFIIMVLLPLDCAPLVRLSCLPLGLRTPQNIASQPGNRPWYAVDVDALTASQLRMTRMAPARRAVQSALQRTSISSGRPSRVRVSWPTSFES